MENEKTVVVYFVDTDNGNCNVEIIGSAFTFDKADILVKEFIHKENYIITALTVAKGGIRMDYMLNANKHLHIYLDLYPFLG